MPLMLAQPGYFVAISKQHINCRFAATAKKLRFSSIAFLVY
jgi:hypothetical protein